MLIPTRSPGPRERWKINREERILLPLPRINIHLLLQVCASWPVELGGDSGIGCDEPLTSLTSDVDAGSGAETAVPASSSDAQDSSCEYS